MKIYLGNRLARRARTVSMRDSVLEQEEAFLLASAEPCEVIPLESGGRAYLWGRVYGVTGADGTFSGVDTVKGDKTVAAAISRTGRASRLEGDFLVVRVDADGHVSLFGDEFNKKEVFYSWVDGDLVAATDLRSVVEVAPPTSYDQPALANLLNVYGSYAPKKHTIYEGIRRLGVGEGIEFDGRTASVVSTPFSPVKTHHYEDTELGNYADLLKSAVEIRGSAAGNWVYLSSGWDSTSMLALLVETYGASSVRAVTGRMIYSERAGVANQFEIDRAQKIADYYSVHLDIIDFDYRTDDYMGYWDEIRGDLRGTHIYALMAYNTMMLGRHVSENGGPDDAVMAGEISDGAHNLGFAQYATFLDHPVLEFREYGDKMMSYLFGPTFLSSVTDDIYADDVVYKLFRSRAGGARFDDASGLSEVDKKVRFLESFFLSRVRLPFFSLSNSSILTREGREHFAAEMRDEYLIEPARDLTPSNLYSWMLHLYNVFHWQGSTVRAFSFGASRHGRELSQPFWDGRIQSFLSSMPESWGRGLDLHPTKYPLKWTLENRVDYPMQLQRGAHSYLYDVIPTFSHDAEILYGSAGKPYFQNLLKDHPFEEVLNSSHFDLGYLRRVVEDYCAGVEAVGQERSDLMAILNLCNIGWY